MRGKSSLVELWNLPMQEVYGLFLIGLINGGLALWVYIDSKRQERSVLWTLGTFLIPKAFFPLYFWNQMPELTWICPKCERDNRAWSRKCGRCNRVYTAEETVARLHGYFEPSDPVVIFWVTFLFQEIARVIAIWIAEGPEVLTATGLDAYSLSSSHFWAVKLIIGNILVWVSLFCITVRCRRSVAAIGLRYNGNLSSFGLPLLLAPALALVSEGFLQGIGWFSRYIASSGLEALIQWEQRQWLNTMPHGLGDSSIILLGFVVLILMPVGEEVLFRGIAYIGFAGRFGRTKGILLSALLFAILHGYIRNFAPSVLGGIPIFLMGVILAWLLIRTRSLIPCIITHSLVNLIWLVIWFGKG